MDENGLNIEGLVVSGGKLFAGLRAPTLDGKAFIVAIDADKLFDPLAPISERTRASFRCRWDPTAGSGISRN